MLIKFKNWDKHNPRKDLKKPWYFSFSNDFFLDTKNYELDSEERLVLIYFLCEASRNNKDGEFFLSREHYRSHSRLPDRALNRAIKKLQLLHIINQPRVRGLYASCDQSVQQNRIEYNITEQTDRTDPVANAPDFNFDKIYQEYPRKEGKQRGIKICQQQIKTAEDHQSLLKATKNYAEKCRRENTEPKYIKQFSTFMGCWRDYLEVHEKPKPAMYRPLPPASPDEWPNKELDADAVKKICDEQFDE